MAKKRKRETNPEKVFRIGYVSASIFPHDVEADGNKRTIRSVSVQKRYRDGDDWKYTASFNLAELPQVQRVIQLAQEYIEGREAEISFDD